MISKILAWLRWFCFAPSPPKPPAVDGFASRLAAHKRKPDPKEVARIRLLEARRTVTWADDREKFGDRYVVPMPERASNVTQAWMLCLDWIEIGVIAMAGSDAVAKHFAGEHIPALPPRDTVDFAQWRVDHWFERRCARDELQRRALALAAKKAAQRSGNAGSAGGPKPHEAERIAELQAALAENSATEPK